MNGISGIKPKVQLVEHPNYRTINVSGVIGGQRPMYFEVVIHSDELKAGEALADADLAPERSEIKRTLECRLLIDPFQAKMISNWLQKNIVEYERLYGKIPSPEELAGKFGHSNNDDLR